MHGAPSVVFRGPQRRVVVVGVEFGGGKRRICFYSHLVPGAPGLWLSIPTAMNAGNTTIRATTSENSHKGRLGEIGQPSAITSLCECSPSFRPERSDVEEPAVASASWQKISQGPSWRPPNHNPQNASIRPIESVKWIVSVGFNSSFVGTTEKLKSKYSQVPNCRPTTK